MACRLRRHRAVRLADVETIPIRDEFNLGCPGSDTNYGQLRGGRSHEANQCGETAADRSGDAVPLSAVSSEIARSASALCSQLAHDRDEILSSLRGIDGSLAPFQNSLLSKAVGDVRTAIGDAETKVHQVFQDVNSTILDAAQACDMAISTANSAAQDSLSLVRVAINMMFSAAATAVMGISSGFTDEVNGIAKVLVDAEAKVIPPIPRRPILRRCWHRSTRESMPPAMPSPDPWTTP